MRFPFLPDLGGFWWDSAVCMCLRNEGERSLGKGKAMMDVRIESRGLVWYLLGHVSCLPGCNSFTNVQ